MSFQWGEISITLQHANMSVKVAGAMQSRVRVASHSAQPAHWIRTKARIRPNACNGGGRHLPIMPWSRFVAMEAPPPTKTPLPSLPPRCAGSGIFRLKRRLHVNCTPTTAGPDRVESGRYPGISDVEARRRARSGAPDRSSCAAAAAERGRRHNELPLPPLLRGSRCLSLSLSLPLSVSLAHSPHLLCMSLEPSP